MTALQGNRMNLSLSPGIGGEGWGEGVLDIARPAVLGARTPLTLSLSPQAGRGNDLATFMRLP